MRCARFPISFDEAESIPGALAKSIRLNVLEYSSVAFADAGITPRQAGLVQLLACDEQMAIAKFLGCEVGHLSRQAGSRGKGTIAFGDLLLMRADVELERRRIAPGTLKDHPVHRADWLIRLLPYCPVSLERLVEICQRCEAPLTWSRCWGVGVCESCREVVPASSEPPIRADLKDGYRLFAALASVDADVRRAGLEQLPELLRHVEPGKLVTMAIRLGENCRAEPIRNVRRESASTLEPAVLAEVVARGATMLQGWPASFIDWSKETLSDRINDYDGYHAARGIIRRLGNPRLEDETQASLVQAAMPSEFSSFSRSAPLADFMTGLELKNSVAHLRPRQLAAVRAALEDRRLPSKQRQRSQFNPERAKTFGEKYRDSMVLSRLTFALMLPTYAIEQLICDKLLDEEKDELVRAARGGVCVTPQSLGRLITQLSRKRSKGEMPSTAVPLMTAARRIGGREKPWSAILRELRRGNLPFWVAGDKVTARTIRVEPTNLARFDEMSFRREDHPEFEFRVECAKCEAEEILNLPPKNLAPLIETGHLEFGREGRILATDLRNVLELAERMTSYAELAAHTGWTYAYACDEAARLGISRVGIGWCRAGCVQHRLIPGQLRAQHGDRGTAVKCDHLPRAGQLVSSDVLL